MKWKETSNVYGVQHQMSKYQQHKCVFAMEKINELEFYKSTCILWRRLAIVGGLDIGKIMLGFIEFENCW